MADEPETQREREIGAEDRLGCGDLLVAVAGMGCATFIRILLIGLIVLIMWAVFHFVFHWV